MCICNQPPPWMQHAVGRSMNAPVSNHASLFVALKSSEQVNFNFSIIIFINPYEGINIIILKTVTIKDTTNITHQYHSFKNRNNQKYEKGFLVFFTGFGHVTELV